MPQLPTQARKFALRADCFDGFKERLIKWLGTVALGWIVAFEAAGINKHVHLIIDSSSDIKKLRNSFVRTFPECVGNKGYSLKLCDDDYDAYIRYICKGPDRDIEPIIWSRQGLLYTDDAIKEAHSKYWVNNSAIIENSKKRKAVEKENIVEQVEKKCKELNLKAHDRLGVARVYIRLFRDARKGINVFAGRAIVNTVCLLLDQGDCSETMLAQKIADL